MAISATAMCTAPVINLENSDSSGQGPDAIHRLAIELHGSTTGEHGRRCKTSMPWLNTVRR